MEKIIPKVTVNGTEYDLLVVKRHYDDGYSLGFEGVGRRNGKYYWIFASGCSCDGTAHTEEIDKATVKTIEIAEGDVYKIGTKGTYNGPDLEFHNYG